MFSKAYALAVQFTVPIIISMRHHSGECSASVGTCVIINEDGWMLTAYHIVNQFQQIIESHKKYNELLEQRKAIENNQSLKPHVRHQQLKSFKIPNDAITRFSIHFGLDNVSLGQIHAIPPVDIAVCQLLNFNKDNIKAYPKFNNISGPIEAPGTSLCKLGFPFHDIKPVYNDKLNSFDLSGSLPLPFFPLEGIYTRTINLEIANSPYNYPLQYIETSSPGLLGQSGGPTFDVNGTIWAIQSSTKHLKLGFGNGIQTKSKENEHLQNQYMNVGWGTHFATITRFLTEKNIKFYYF